MTGILTGETQNITFLNTKWLRFSSGTGKVSFRLSHLSKVSVRAFDWLGVYDYVCSLCDIWCNFRNFSTCTTAWSNRAATCPTPSALASLFLHERMINSFMKPVCNTHSYTHTGLCGRSNYVNDLVLDFGPSRCRFWAIANQLRPLSRLPVAVEGFLV